MTSINGIGTKLYGKRDAKSDGSYVATKWFTFLLLPIFPLGSYRVLRGKTSVSTLGLIGSSTQYRMDKVKFNWPQVLTTFVVIWGIFIVSIYSLIYLANNGFLD